jgi:TRAP-type mannitol/chloroaromatic compound transport system substrate-binding protein
LLYFYAVLGIYFVRIIGTVTLRKTFRPSFDRAGAIIGRNISMDRRSFLKTSAMGGTAAAASTLAAPAYAQGKRTLTMVTSWPRGFAVLDDAASYLEKFVSDMSDGNLTIDKKAPGELVGALEVFDAVSSGQADMYHSADYYFIGQHPGFAYYTAVPFGGTAQEVTNWYEHGGGQQMHDSLGEIFNLKGLLAGNSGSQSGGWFRKEINSADDFNGLKFRMPGLGGKVLGKLGASVQNIPGGELYQALSSGALDGLEWVGPMADERAGFQEVAKVYYTAGFHEPGSALAANVNLDVWNDLTPQHQAILQGASRAVTYYQLSETLANNGAALARLQQQGVKTLQFSDDVWDAFGAASAEVMDENMGDSIFADIRNSFEESLANSASWINKSDGYYLQQRIRVLGG